VAAAEDLHLNSMCFYSHLIQNLTYFICIEVGHRLFLHTAAEATHPASRPDIRTVVGTITEVGATKARPMKVAEVTKE
jgi:hypothetical protein